MIEVRYRRAFHDPQTEITRWRDDDGQAALEYVRERYLGKPHYFVDFHMASGERLTYAQLDFRLNGPVTIDGVTI